MRPTLPFAGTTVPVEGFSHFVDAMLRSHSLEDGLRVLLDAIIADRAIEAGLWVWPEPSVSAIGLIGTARLYEVQHHELASVPPPDQTLVEWTQRAGGRQLPDSQAGDAKHPRANAQRLACSSGSSTTHLGANGAICLPSTWPTLSPEEQLWYGTWLDWLAEREHQLRDAKLRALAEFAGGAGHEINNPLGTILGRSQLLLRQESDPERRRWLAAIGGQALRIRDMISDTMVFARPPAPQQKTVEIEPLIHSVTDRFSEELIAAEIQLRLHIDFAETTGDSPLAADHLPPVAQVDPEQFQVVLIELMRNAIRAAGQGGQLGLRSRTRTWQGQNWLELDLFNNGPELTSAERTHAFDPFFSGRDAGRGLGFGLTKCWSIVTGHDGRIGVQSNSDWTVFRTLWPLSQIRR